MQLGIIGSAKKFVWVSPKDGMEKLEGSAWRIQYNISFYDDCED